MIPINFASRDYRLLERIQIVLLAAIVILCIATAGMIWTAASLRKNISVTDLKLQGLEAADESMRLAIREREQLVKDLSLMSGLMESRRFSWTLLLSRVEAVVPVGMALKRVEFRPADHTLTLEGTTQSPEALRNLVVGLEKSSSFKDPFLKHQSLEKGSNSFDVVAVYRENAGPAVAQGK
jgi:Tfp pilus assembly protein PilN